MKEVKHNIKLLLLLFFILSLIYIFIIKICKTDPIIEEWTPFKESRRRRAMQSTTAGNVYARGVKQEYGKRFGSQMRRWSPLKRHNRPQKLKDRRQRDSEQLSAVMAGSTLISRRRRKKEKDNSLTAYGNRWKINSKKNRGYQEKHGPHWREMMWIDEKKNRMKKIKEGRLDLKRRKSFEGKYRDARKKGSSKMDKQSMIINAAEAYSRVIQDMKETRDSMKKSTAEFFAQDEEIKKLETKEGRQSIEDAYKNLLEGMPPPPEQSHWFDGPKTKEYINQFSNAKREAGYVASAIGGTVMDQFGDEAEKRRNLKKLEDDYEQLYPENVMDEYGKRVGGQADERIHKLKTQSMIDRSLLGDGTNYELGQDILIRHNRPQDYDLRKGALSSAAMILENRKIKEEKEKRERKKKKREMEEKRKHHVDRLRLETNRITIKSQLDYWKGISDPFVVDWIRNMGKKELEREAENIDDGWNWPKGMDKKERFQWLMKNPQYKKIPLGGRRRSDDELIITLLKHRWKPTQKQIDTKNHRAEMEAKRKAESVARREKSKAEFEEEKRVRSQTQESTNFERGRLNEQTREQTMKSNNARKNWRVQGTGVRFSNQSAAIAKYKRDSGYTPKEWDEFKSTRNQEEQEAEILRQIAELDRAQPKQKQRRWR